MARVSEEVALPCDPFVSFPRTINAGYADKIHNPNAPIQPLAYLHRINRPVVYQDQLYVIKLFDLSNKKIRQMAERRFNGLLVAPISRSTFTLGSKVRTLMPSPISLFATTT